MTKNVSKISLLFILAILLSVLMLTESAKAAGTDRIGVKVMEKETVGDFLAAGNGMTLYYYAKDETDVSHCMEGCAINWPPFYADPSTVAEGCESSDFAVISRDDGRKQTTYKGRPLYYFKNDTYPGDTFGQGIGNVWFLVKP